MNRAPNRASKGGMRISALLLFGLLLGLGSGRPAGSDTGEPGVSECVRAAVVAIQGRYEAVRDLRASFQQTTRSVALGAAGPVTKTRGHVVFAKPGRMRWSYTEPEESLVVSDGHWLWLYDAARAEAQKLEVGDGFLSGAAIQFLLGEGRILRDFRVDAESCDAQEARLTLVPREPASYEKLRVRADRASGHLLETEITDLLGNVTHVAFADVETNLDPPPELFRFEAPPGVEVIELDAPGGRP